MQHYTTTDLQLAAVISLYYPLEGINHDTAAFLFQGDASIESLVEQYHRGDVVVEPHTFLTQLEALRVAMVNEDSHPSIEW